jgi:hypothetical protein
MSMLKSPATKERTEIYYTVRAIVRFAFWFALGYGLLIGLCVLAQ